MRATFAWSPSETIMLLPSLRFTLGDLDERMCRVFVWCRTILPVPVFLKRLAAPECVFNLGIVFSLYWRRAVAQSKSSANTGTSLHELRLPKYSARWGLAPVWGWSPRRIGWARFHPMQTCELAHSFGKARQRICQAWT